MIITIIAFVIVFGVLVTVHEFGHYYVAKRSGILVREFSIGMGPKLLRTGKTAQRTQSGFSRWAVTSGWRGWTMRTPFKREWQPF